MSKRKSYYEYETEETRSEVPAYNEQSKRLQNALEILNSSKTSIKNMLSESFEDAMQTDDFSEVKALIVINEQQTKMMSSIEKLSMRRR